MAHTPGPWKVHGTEIWAEHRRITMGRGAYDEKDRATRDANARLITSAPDLLAALRALEARTETRIDYCFCETAKAIDGDLPCLFCLKQQARAAIEKAS